MTTTATPSRSAVALGAFSSVAAATIAWLSVEFAIRWLVVTVLLVPVVPGVVLGLLSGPETGGFVAGGGGYLLSVFGVGVLEFRVEGLAGEDPVSTVVFGLIVAGMGVFPARITQVTATAVAARRGTLVAAVTGAGTRTGLPRAASVRPGTPQYALATLGATVGLTLLAVGAFSPGLDRRLSAGARVGAVLVGAVALLAATVAVRVGRRRRRWLATVLSSERYEDDGPATSLWPAYRTFERRVGGRPVGVEPSRVRGGVGVVVSVPLSAAGLDADRRFTVDPDGDRRAAGDGAGTAADTSRDGADAAGGDEDADGAVDEAAFDPVVAAARESETSAVVEVDDTVGVLRVGCERLLTVEALDEVVDAAAETAATVERRAESAD